MGYFFGWCGQLIIGQYNISRCLWVKVSAIINSYLKLIIQWWNNRGVFVTELLFVDGV